MIENRIAPQVQYNTLDNFIQEQNNFYLYFIDNCLFSNEIYRNVPSFKRFQELHPKMEKDITEKTVKAMENKSRDELPYERLWNAYNIMSQLVYLEDKHVIRDGKPDIAFLSR